MKKLFWPVLFAIFAFIFIYYQQTLPCKRPLAYDIGTIDEKHAISKDELVTILGKAEVMWEDSSGKDLFVYKPGSRFKVNLIYDERQAEYDREKKEALSLGLSEEMLQIEKDRLYLRQSAYETRLANYNKTVANWNKRGGAPPSVLNDLETERLSLVAEGKNIESLVNDYNNLVKNFNSRVSDFNALAHEETTAGEARSRGEINIFIIDRSPSDTVLFAHELGHALGLDHVDDSKSIMYYRLVNDINTASKEDLKALNSLCGNKT